MTLDSIDRKILRVIQKKGRISNADLSEKVGLSPSACHRRVQRLETDGIVRDYVALLDPRTIGLPSTIFVEIKLQGQADEILDAFEAEVKRVPEILECHMVAGGFDYLIKARLADMAAYRAFLGEILVQMPGVRETRTYAVLEEVKNTVRLPL